MRSRLRCHLLLRHRPPYPRGASSSLRFSCSSLSFWTAARRSFSMPHCTQSAGEVAKSSNPNQARFHLMRSLTSAWNTTPTYGDLEGSSLISIDSQSSLLKPRSLWHTPTAIKTTSTPTCASKYSISSDTVTRCAPASPRSHHSNRAISDDLKQASTPWPTDAHQRSSIGKTRRRGECADFVFLCIVNCFAGS